MKKTLIIEKRITKFRGYCEFGTAIVILLYSLTEWKSFIVTIMGIILLMFGAWDLSNEN